MAWRRKIFLGLGVQIPPSASDERKATQNKQIESCCSTIAHHRGRNVDRRSVFLCLEQSGELAGGILLHHREHVRIDAKGDFDTLVPQALLHHRDWHASLQEQRRAGMPESMKLHGLDPSLAAQSFEFPLANGVTLQRLP